MMRHTWIDSQAGATIALSRQCVLAGISRAALYARRKPKRIVQDDEQLLRLIDEEYTRHPFYGGYVTVNCGNSGHRREE